MATISTVGMNAAGAVMNNDNTAAAAGLPVDEVTTTWRTVYRVVWPTPGCLPGDVYRVHGEASVTNNVGRAANGTITGVRYIVGIGFHLWYYDVDYQGTVPVADRMIKIGDSEGENVTPELHHLPLDITRWFTVPATWEPGHRPVLVLRADAHSTAWNENGGGDTITVDKLGLIEAFRWTAAPAAG